jgi:hypothetical protein
VEGNKMLRYLGLVREGAG